MVEMASHLGSAGKHEVFVYSSLCLLDTVPVYCTARDDLPVAYCVLICFGQWMTILNSRVDLAIRNGHLNINLYKFR